MQAALQDMTKQRTVPSVFIGAGAEASVHPAFLSPSPALTRCALSGSSQAASTSVAMTVRTLRSCAAVSSYPGPALTSRCSRAAATQALHQANKLVPLLKEAGAL